MSSNNSQKKRSGVKFTPDFFTLAKDVFSVPAVSFNETKVSLFILNFIKSVENTKVDVDNFGNILIKKGTSNFYPCFLAHMDTVHEYYFGFNLLIKDNYIFSVDNNKKQVGCGADDKAGILICLHLLKHVENIKIVFCSCEESGGIGSKNIDKNFFSDCSFLCSVDRWGNSDFITEYSRKKTVSEDFIKDTKKLLNHYQYKETSGMFTDSFNIQNNGVELSCINISCGYYKHHSEKEFFDIFEGYKCYLLCFELCKLSLKQYAHILQKNYTFDWNERDYFQFNNYPSFKKDNKKSVGDNFCMACNCILDYGNICNDCLESALYNECCPVCGCELSPDAICEVCNVDYYELSRQYDENRYKKLI
jgi:tripeptide aminopeptidase